MDRFMIPADYNRSYMKAIRALLGYKQYTILRLIKDERIIRESEISAIEGKIGYTHLWPVYADCMMKEIDRSSQSETIKLIMKSLLKEWEEAK